MSKVYVFHLSQIPILKEVQNIKIWKINNTGEEEVRIYSKEISSCFSMNPDRVRQKQQMHIHNGNLLIRKCLKDIQNKITQGLIQSHKIRLF